MSDGVATVASRVHATYRAAALRQVAKGAWSRDEAAQRLAPWGALTALCGGDVPGYTDRFDELYPVVSRYPADLPGADARTDDIRRFLLSEDLCPAGAWKPVLVTAWAEAALRADQLRDAGQPDQFARALAAYRDLNTLARFLGLPLRDLCMAHISAARLPERIAA